MSSTVPPAATPLPCDGNGVCMRCKSKPTEPETLSCKTCATPWHVDCLSAPPKSMSDVAQWECPDCCPPEEDTTRDTVPRDEGEGGLVAAIRAIEADNSLSDTDKARKRQALLSGNVGSSDVAVKDDNEILSILGENIKCSFCMQLPDRPVTTPCGHNFCLKCFEKWTRQGKKTCAKCRQTIPHSMTSQPRINSSLVFAIRMARTQKPAAVAANTGAPRVFKFIINNDDLPDECFTTSRAVKSGKANARSGKIFVTIAHDHLGPITAEYDPIRNTGVLVGDSWTDRMACRQWGAHFPHISGIAGQSQHGAQSVVLSGGYEDDEDHGEWFIYTGSGGRDLSGNKRTNKEQSFDQKFTGQNESLRLSCIKGYPVRVVRSFKEKRSNYAPETGVRYDGIYRIEKCWLKARKEDKEGKRHKVCRYLFVRCDNSPAPWTSDEHGDRPRQLPNVPELKQATELTQRKGRAAWDFDEVEGSWKWFTPAPKSKIKLQKARKEGGGEVGVVGGDVARLVREAEVGVIVDSRPKKISKPKRSSKEKIMKEFSCHLCRKVLNLPITTPCAHNFCKACLDGAFEGQNFMRERQTGGRQLRTQKTVRKCPSCPTDLSSFLQTAEVNRELMGVIESLIRKFEEEEKSEEVGQDEISDIMEEDKVEDAAPEDVEIIASDSKETETITTEDTDDVEVKVEVAAPKDEEIIASDSKETETITTEDTDDVEDKAETSLTVKRGCPRKNAVTFAAPEDEENIASDSKVIETISTKDTVGVEDKAEPASTRKRGRPRKNFPAPAVPEDVKNIVSDSKETEAILIKDTDDVEDKAEQAPARKRGRPRKNAAASAEPAKTRAQKEQKAADNTADDGNDSPSSPLHVLKGNELD